MQVIDRHTEFTSERIEHRDLGLVAASTVEFDPKIGGFLAQLRDVGDNTLPHPVQRLGHILLCPLGSYIFGRFIEALHLDFVEWRNPLLLQKLFKQRSYHLALIRFRVNEGNSKNWLFLCQESRACVQGIDLRRSRHRISQKVFLHVLVPTQRFRERQARMLCVDKVGQQGNAGS